MTTDKAAAPVGAVPQGDCGSLRERIELSLKCNWPETEVEYAWSSLLREAEAALASQAARMGELEALLNTPHTADWFDGVRLEAGHQIQRWGSDHDAGKQPHDWFWLIGYLAGKALASAMAGNVEKALHHTISTGAALLNWHRALTGDTNAMRPGIPTPLPPMPSAIDKLRGEAG